MTEKETIITTRTYRLSLIDRLLGTIPKNAKLFTKFIQKRYECDPDDPAKAEEQAMHKPIEKPDGDGETGFFTDPDGVYIMDYHIKGFLKEAGNVLKDALKIKALRSKVENYLFVEPRYIWLKEKIDGELERPLRGQTPQGVRITLVSSDYIDPPCSFTIKLSLIKHKELTWDVVEQLLDYGKYKGLGQWRNASFGRFTWERIE